MNDQSCCVFGLVVAKSLRIWDHPCPFFLVSVRHNMEQFSLMITHPIWHRSLHINQSYEFTDLEYESVTFRTYCKPETVGFWRTTPTTTYKEFRLSLNSNIVNSWTDTNSSNLFPYIEGIVSGELSPLGDVPFSTSEKRTFTLSIFLVGPWMKGIPFFTKGSKVKVYNVHFAPHQTLLMCARSYLEVENGSGRVDRNVKPSDIPLAYLPGAVCGYQTYASLRRQTQLLVKDKFDLSFASEKTGWNRTRHVEILSKLLEPEFTVARTKKVTLDLIDDFISDDHYCLYYKRFALPNADKISFLRQQVVRIASSFKLNETQSRQWHSGTINCIIGRLTISNTTGYWQIGDKSHTSLLVTTLDKPINTTLVGQIVMVERSDLNIEHFQAIKTDEVTPFKRHMYIVNRGDIIPLFKPSMKLDMRPLMADQPEYTFNYSQCFLCRELNKCYVPHYWCLPCANVWTQDAVLQYDGRRGSIFSVHTHVVVVHHIATPMLLTGGPVCYVLVSVLQHKIHLAEAGVRQCVLVFTGKLFGALHLIQPGRSYRLHMPKLGSHRFADFSQRVTHVPIINLQEDVFITRHECTQRESWYEAELCEKAFGDLCIVEGIVVERMEVKPNFESERFTVGVHGYGVLGCKSMQLMVQDGNGKDFMVYLNKWNRKRYPLGILPGAYVIINLVKSTVSLTNNNAYYQSTDLTSVMIVSLPDPVERVKLYWFLDEDISVSLSRNKPGRMVCGVLRCYTIVSAELLKLCVTCGNSYPCKNQCRASESKMSVKAKVIAQGSTHRVAIFFKNDLVRQLLDVSEEDWKYWLRFADRRPLKYERHFKDKPGVEVPGYIEQFFQTFVHSRELRYRPLYVRCRPFKSDSTAGMAFKAEQARTRDDKGEEEIGSVFCVELSWKHPHLGLPQ